MSPDNTLTAEIVTFRTDPRLDTRAVLASARALDPFLAARPGFLSRHLSRAEDGTWTDHLLWADPASAHAASEALMGEPAAGAFMAAILPDSVAMSHAPVLLRQSR